MGPSFEESDGDILTLALKTFLEKKNNPKIFQEVFGICSKWFSVNHLICIYSIQDCTFNVSHDAKIDF